VIYFIYLYFYIKSIYFKFNIIKININRENNNNILNLTVKQKSILNNPTFKKIYKYILNLILIF